MQEIKTDAITGEVTVRTLTPEEVAARQARLRMILTVEDVTPYQARVALLQLGLLDKVEALMADESTPREARIAWEYATIVQRQSAFIATLGPALGLTDEQIDDLFRVAAQVA